MKLTQSLAIMRYIGEQYNLAGTTPKERAAISVMENYMLDLLRAFSLVTYNPNYFTLKQEHLKEYLPNHLTLLSDYFSDSLFVTGSNVSYVDFYVYEYLYRMSVLAKEVFDQFPTLKAFISRIQSFPKVADYIQATKPKLFCKSIAKWNGMG